MQCVILAGGLGTRIRTRRSDLPKALIPVLGKPFVFYQLEWLASQKVSRVLLSLGYGSDRIVEAVGDGSAFGLRVDYVDEGDELRGTGGALRLAADLGVLEAGFFVLYGDSYLPIEIGPIWRTSEEGKVPTMTILRNDGRWDKSNVLYRGGRLVLYDKSVPDPSALGMDFIDYGLSVLTRDAVLKGIPSGTVMDLAVLFNRLSREGRLKAYEVFQRFYEIGSPEGLDEFEAFMSSQP